MNLIQELLQCRTHTAADGRFALSGSTPHYAPDRLFATRHIRLELSLDFSRKSLSGRCTTSLEALADPAGEMVFDAVGFRDLRVSAKGYPVRHTYDGRRIKVSFPKPMRRGNRVEVSIDYRVVQPALGLHFVGPDKSYPKKPLQAWTQGEDEYNRYWFPCHDAPQERTTTEMIITVPEPFTAISNGGLLRLTKRAGKRTYHWKHNVPHSPYLVSLAVGIFTEIRDRWKNVPVTYYVTPGQEADAHRAFDKTPKMMEFFSKKTGVPYAYAKYSQVAAVDFIYGGMENTSCTTQTALTLHDERAHMDFTSDPLVAHELAHQWFGDLVTCKDWSHAWLNESFATYFEALFKEHDMGYDEFMVEMRGNADAYFDEDRERYRRPMVTRNYKNTNDLFDRHLYEKGSLILHLLRNLLGEDAWWRSIQVYLKRHRGGSVETTDLIQAIQDATGRNMRPFFDEWIFKAGHPEYKVRFWWDAKTKKINLRVLQTHAVNGETGLFSVPVHFDFYFRGKRHRHTHLVDKKDQLISFELPHAPEIVLFDPDHVILKKADVAKSEAMWVLQLSEDPHVLGRIDAAAALGRLGSPTAVAALQQALRKDKFWAVQAEAARALGQSHTKTARDILVEGLETLTHPKVRRAVYDALAQYPTTRVQSNIKAIVRDEASYFAEAEAIRTLGRMKDPALLGLFKEYTRRESWNDILRIAGLEAIANLQLAESITILKEFSRYGIHPNTRMTAIRRLAGFGKGREDIQDFLVRLLNDRYLLVQLSVVRSLGAFADERAVPALLKLTTGDRDGRLKRAAEEAVRKIRKGMDNEFPANDQPSKKRAT